MVYRIAGGIAFILLGASMLFSVGIPTWATALTLIIAGIALLAGV